jgi:xanthine dehydrogenase accessory factor
VDLLSEAVELRRRGERFAFVTVVGCEGSSPRHLGAKMIVREDGTVLGTVGGGALEARAVERARAAVAAGRPERLSVPLGPALGQCCGGQVELFVEPDLPAERLLLFGAGHVAMELARAAAPLGFEVTVVDSRAEWNSAGRFPGAERLLEDGDEALGNLTLDARSTYCAVMTHRHDLDELLVRRLLERPIRYLGLIGSRTKWARFRERFAERGLPAEAVARVRCPMGLDVKAETPAEIAAAVAAELVLVRRTPLALAASPGEAEAGEESA